METVDIDHGLTPRQINMLREALAPHAAKIVKVGLFGSRAQGTHRPGSDIDLVIFGNPDERALREIGWSLEESLLPFFVDVLVYDKIDSERLRAHIDLVFLPLFTGEGLRQLAPKPD